MELICNYDINGNITAIWQDIVEADGLIHEYVLADDNVLTDLNELLPF